MAGHLALQGVHLVEESRVPRGAPCRWDPAITTALQHPATFSSCPNFDWTGGKAADMQGRVLELTLWPARGLFLMGLSGGFLWGLKDQGVQLPRMTGSPLTTPCSSISLPLLDPRRLG